MLLSALPPRDAPWRLVRGNEARGLSRGLQQGTWAPLQSRPDRTAYRVETPDGPIFVKHYTPKGLVARVRDFGIRRKPQRAFTMGLRLAQGGVDTAEPLGLFGLGRGLLHEVLLVNRWLGPTRMWTEHLTREARREGLSPKVREAVQSLARLLGRLHRLGLYHGDLPGNLVFGQEDGGWRPFLVDLEELHQRLPRKRRVKNLEELGRSLSDLSILTLRDRWGFLQEYAVAAGLGSAEPARLWREGREAQLRRARRAQKRGRE